VIGVNEQRRKELATALRMMEQIAKASPRIKARMAGVFYLLNIVTGVLALVLVGRGFPVYGDVAILIATVCYIVVTLLFYGIFKPVNRNLSLLAAFFSLVGCGIGALWTAPQK
jgi:hypothetical protein